MRNKVHGVTLVQCTNWNRVTRVRSKARASQNQTSVIRLYEFRGFQQLIYLWNKIRTATLYMIIDSKWTFWFTSITSCLRSSYSANTNKYYKEKTKKNRKPTSRLAGNYNKVNIKMPKKQLCFQCNEELFFKVNGEPEKCSHCGAYNEGTNSNKA